MSNLDFDDVLSDFDETDTYYSDSDYDPDEDSIECIECDELGNIADIIDIPYNEISGVMDAAVGAGFHAKVNKPAIKVKTKATVKIPKAKVKAKTKIVTSQPHIIGPIVAAVAKPNATISSILKATATVKTPVIKPGTKPAEVLKKLAVHPKIQASGLNVSQLKKLAVAVAVKPAVKAGATISGPLGINIPFIPPIPTAIKTVLPSIAPIIAPITPLPLPIAATSPVVAKTDVVISPQKVEHIRKAKKLSKKRPKQSVTFIPPKKHEMICLGQMVPRRLYDLIIEFHKHKKQKRKERACKCADAVKTTEKKLRATGGMAPTHIRRKGKGSAAKRGTKSGIKTIRVQPESYIRIACGLPA